MILDWANWFLGSTKLTLGILPVYVTSVGEIGDVRRQLEVWPVRGKSRKQLGSHTAQTQGHEPTIVRTD